LCVAIADSIWGQMRSSQAAKSRPRMLPTRRWTTRDEEKAPHATRSSEYWLPISRAA
jgi:hypothetical protein